MNSCLSLRALTVAGALGASSFTSGNAQGSVGMGVGGGEGSVGGAVLHVSVRAPVFNDLHFAAGNIWMAGLGGCADQWPESYRCGFDGSTLYVGPMLRMLSNSRLSIGVSGMVGWFSDLGNWPSGESTLAWGLGAGGDVAVVRRLRGELAVQHWRLDDDRFEELFNEKAYVTIVSAGFRFVLWQ